MSVLAAKAAFMEPPMEAVSAARPQGSTLARVLRGLRPTAPAAFAGFALGLSFALLMPMAWLSAICWNLYLDKLHPIFIEPLGGAARIGVGLGLGVIAMLLAVAAVLALATPAGQARLARFRRRAPATDFGEYMGVDEPAPNFPRRRSADIHPDAPAVAPINALRDLPAGGLGPVPMIGAANDMAMGEVLAATAVTVDEMLELADFADASCSAAVTESEDTSLGAMVARLEAGVMRQRGDGGEASSPPVDLALEAALSTLARMNQRAVG